MLLAYPHYTARSCWRVADRAMVTHRAVARCYQRLLAQDLGSFSARQQAEQLAGIDLLQAPVESTFPAAGALVEFDWDRVTTESLTR